MKQRWGASLTSRLVLSFAVVVTAAMIVVGLVTLFVATAIIRQSVIERLEAIADLKERELARWIEDQEAEVALLADSATVRASAGSLLRTDIDDARNGSSYSILSRVLAPVVRTQSNFEEIFVLSLDGGQIVFSTDPSREGEYHVNDQYFREGQKDLFVQNIYPSPTTFRPTLTIAAPLRDEAGILVGVIAAHVDLDRMDQIVFARSGLGETGEAYLIDRYNDFVSSVQYGRDRFPRGVHTTGIDAGVRGIDGYAEYNNYLDDPVIGVYRWLDDQELVLMVEMARSEAYRPAQQLAWAVIGVGMVLMLLVSFIVVSVSRQITRPIGALTDAARKVADGDLTAQAPELTNDEIGALSRTFNRMTRQLDRLYSSMEDEVAARTQDLTRINAQLQQVAAELSEKNTKLQHGLELAHDIQLGLLPEHAPWPVEWVAAAGRSRPSDEVGGDFYSFIELGPQRIAVAIGDISGKGVGAALMMALTSNTLEERARRYVDPVQLFADLDRQLGPRLQANQMNAALLYAAINVQTLSLSMINAGMIAPILLREGRVAYLNAHGLPIGTRLPPIRTLVEFPLKPGDSLLLLSDGIVEAHNEQDEIWGFERLDTVLESLGALSTTELTLDTILAKVDAWKGSAPQHDDMTMVWVHLPEDLSVAHFRQRRYSR